MNNLSEWVSIIGLIAAIITILIGVKRIGNVEQSVKDGIAHLEKESIEEKATIKEVVNKFEHHFNDRSIHRNVELEARIAQELDKFQLEVKSKLDKLLMK